MLTISRGNVIPPTVIVPGVSISPVLPVIVTTPTLISLALTIFLPSSITTVPPIEIAIVS
jgi:hypothetical protein